MGDSGHDKFHVNLMSLFGILNIHLCFTKTSLAMIFVRESVNALGEGRRGDEDIFNESPMPERWSC